MIQQAYIPLTQLTMFVTDNGKRTILFIITDIFTLCTLPLLNINLQK